MDLANQRRRIEREYSRNPRVRYGGAVSRAYDNAVYNNLSRQGTAGRMVIDMSRATDSSFQPGDNGFSGGNTVQRLYRASQLGNKTAEKLLNTKTDTRTLTAAKGSSNG